MLVEEGEGACGLVLLELGDKQAAGVRGVLSAGLVGVCESCALRVVLRQCVFFGLYGVAVDGDQKGALLR